MLHPRTHVVIARTDIPKNVSLIYIVQVERYASGSIILTIDNALCIYRDPFVVL